MSFKKVFRGYDPKEVDKYIEETAAKEKQIRVSQKERIDELSDENYALRQQVRQYQTDEQAISKSLIASQSLAQEVKFDAEKYSELVLTRAKIFYATWHAYAQTLISSLSPEEVAEFNKLQRKIEYLIYAYEGTGAKATQQQESSAKAQDAAATVSTAPQSVSAEIKPSAATMGVTNNPISKIEQAAEQAIDLKELVRPELSLEELCAELGLTVKK